MIAVEERVERLEETFGRFLEETSRIFAGIQEEIAEIRADNAHRDRQFLIAQQATEKARQETAEEFRRVHQKAEKARQETAEEFRRVHQKADEDRRQTEKARQETAEEFRRVHERADQDRQRADQDRQRAEKEQKDFNRRLAEITDSQGLLIENMVWPNLERIAGQVFGDDAVIVTQAIRVKRIHPEDRGRIKEIDLFAASPTAVLVCEAKSKPTSEKTREFLTSLENFKEYFPEYKEMRIVPMVASIAFDPSLVRFMTNQGVLALGFGDGTMELLNPEAANQGI